MGWVNSIRAKAEDLVFKAAWRKGQKLRLALDEAVIHIFQELVTVSVDVLRAPDLGSASVTWRPLSDSWIERKGGMEEFYFHTGELEQTLLSKDGQELRILGRPQVFLDVGGQSLKITSIKPPKKYKGMPMAGLKIRAIPFPKLDSAVWGAVEGLVFEEGSKDWWKIMGGQRWMMTPFFRWWIKVRTKRIIKAVLK